MKDRPNVSKPLKPILLLTSLVLFCALCCPTSASAGWVKRYNGPGNSEDKALAMAVDAAGNVYVTGYSYGSDSFESADYATIKYDSDGNRQWTARYNGPGNAGDIAAALVVDAAGNVYVTGYSKGTSSDFDYATIKYDSDGKRQWAARYNGPGNEDDYARAIAVDGDGNVFVTGKSYTGVTEGSDYATIKYDSDGNEKWVARYNGPQNGGQDSAYAIAVSALGNVYVTGYSDSFFSVSGSDYATVKYNTDGKELWARRYNGPGDSYDEAHSIALDKVGNIYITGSSIGRSLSEEYATVKYNPNGHRKWVRRYKGPTILTDYAHSIAVDTSGNVYVTGESWTYASHMDYATVKYNTNGKEEMVKRYDGPGKDWDAARAIAVDDTGNVYVTGFSCASYSSESADYATIKYDSNGKRKWVRRYNGPANGEDNARAIAVDAAGNIYVTGYSYGDSSGFDYATVKYDKNGN